MSSSGSHPGFLLVIEGVDGAGKSSLLPRLAEFCKELGAPCVLSREPTDGPWGRRLRESASTGRLSLREELDLFLKDREEHVADRIAPALREGKTVLLDRYYLSTAAYQGARGGVPEEILAENERFAPAPDLVLLLDLDPAAGLARVRKRGDQPNAFEHLAALQEVRRIFLSISRPWIERIDASRTPEEVAAECCRIFSERYAEKRRLTA